MDQPLVSVIIPTFNRDTFLRQAIESVTKQTYHNIEICVVDDGSEENYAEAICADYDNCQYFYKENGGLSSARNYGIQKARGDFIAFLDDDDFWKADKIEKQLAAFRANTEVDLVHSSVEVVDKNGKPTGKVLGASPAKSSKRSGKVFWNAIGTWVVKSPTPLIKREVFTTDLLFDESIKVGEDVDFYQRFFYRHKVKYLAEPLAYYRDFGDDGRLSQQRKKYIGIELKMLENFKAMGVTNPWTLHCISIHLVKQAIRNWNIAYPDKPKKISRWQYLIRPNYVLKHCFKAPR